MHFYSHLITILYPFVPLNESHEVLPDGYKYVVDYNDKQVVTYNGDILIAKKD